MGTRRYRIEEVIGSGGFGAVYRATLLGDDGFEKPVALKLVGDSEQHDARDRLIDEARILGRMQHRAIPTVDGLLTITDGRKVLVMEYVPGADLFRVAQRAGPLPIGPLAAVAAEVASALDSASRAPGPRGPVALVHRDVKPSNVMLTPAGHVKLLDFGIARGELDRVSRTATGEALGTTHYMAPEAFEGAPCPASDIYSLALTLLSLRQVDLDEILGLQPPEFHDTVARRRVEAAEVPRPLATLLVHMLAFRETERPAAADVAKRFRSIAAAHKGLDLAAYADDVFSILPPASRSDDLVGQVLTEAEPAPPAAPAPAAPPPPPRPSRLPYVLAAMVLLGLLVGAALLAVTMGAGALWWATG